MKRISLPSLLLMFAAGITLPQSALAQMDAMRLGGKVGVFGNVGYALFGMQDVNDEIDLINDAITLTGGETADKIHGGLNAGGGVMIGVTDYLLVGAEANYLWANTKAKFGSSDEYKLELPGLEVGVFAKLAMPLAEQMLISVGAGLEYYWVMGKSSATGLDQDIKGSNLGGKVMVGGEYFLLPEFMSLGVDIGYRFAKITEVKDQEDQVIPKTLGTDNFTVDYSGPFFLGTVRVYF